MRDFAAIDFESSIFETDMRDFAAIDFETANFQFTSVCSVGVVIVRNGEISDSFYSLIQPEPNYYNRLNTSIHGLCRQDTEDAPVFPKVWKEVEKLLVLNEEDAKWLGRPYLPLVAHNKAFDETCLKAVFRCYQMDYPDYDFYDTLWASRRVMPDLENHQLQTVAEACGYCLEHHHNALADAEACAWIAMKVL